MFLIVGLGNPGVSYEHTRHNIGFMILDAFKQDSSAPPYRLYNEFHAQLSHTSYKTHKIILAKPQTFMNASGLAVSQMMSYYHISMQQLIIVHDDADLPLGTMKLQQGRGAGGHHGVESIIEYIKEKKLIRMRVGVSPCPQEKRPKSETFILKTFSPKEETTLQDITQRALSILRMIMDEGLEKTAQRVNQGDVPEKQREKKITD